MSYIVLLISVFVLATVEGKPYGLDNGRIVGGEEVSIEDYPYQVSVRLHDQFFCGGSIISAISVLTAAHCVYDKDHSQYSIRAGSSNHSQGQSVLVSQVKENNAYNPITQDNDIAILILNSPLSYGPTIQPIALSSHSPADNSNAYVSGWGILEKGGTSIPIYLRAVDVKIVNFDTCNRNYAWKLTKQMICASSPGKDSCQGDSGGPLASGGVLVGVVSFGYGCADPQYPGIYTSVPRLLSWIHANMES